MFQKFVFLSIFLSIYAFADTPKTLSLPDFSDLEERDPNSKLNLTVSCQDEMGKNLEKDDPGYQACLRRSTDKEVLDFSKKKKAALNLNL